MNTDPFLEPDIDLYALHLLRSVAKFRGFTAAAQECGISQSALTRQVQAIEKRLGIQVFERTTRSVKITEPGAVLLRETAAIPNILSGAMRRIREEYLDGRREIRIGISRSLALAHIPGIFHAQRKLQPEVTVIVSQPSSDELLKSVSNASLDLAILTRPATLPANVTLTHTMNDPFSLLIPSQSAVPPSSSMRDFRHWALAQSWLLPPRTSRSREIIDTWAHAQKVQLQPAMELENFDLMIQLASMGMGVAFIPRRSLASFPRKRLVRLLAPPSDLSRELIVISPSHMSAPEHLTRFVAGILFS